MVFFQRSLLQINKLFFEGFLYLNQADIHFSMHALVCLNRLPLIKCCDSSKSTKDKYAACERWQPGSSPASAKFPPGVCLVCSSGAAQPSSGACLSHPAATSRARTVNSAASHQCTVLRYCLLLTCPHSYRRKNRTKINYQRHWHYTVGFIKICAPVFFCELRSHY